jgi:hypothetical protein
MVLLHDMGQSLAHLLVHAIFSIKDRRPFLLSEEIRNEIYFGVTYHNMRGAIASATAAWAILLDRSAVPGKRPNSRARLRRVPVYAFNPDTTGTRDAALILEGRCSQRPLEFGHFLAPKA